MKKLLFCILLFISFASLNASSDDQKLVCSSQQYASALNGVNNLISTDASFIYGDSIKQLENGIIQFDAMTPHTKWDNKNFIKSGGNQFAGIGFIIAKYEFNTKNKTYRRVTSQYYSCDNLVMVVDNLPNNHWKEIKKNSVIDDLYKTVIELK